MTSSTLSWSAMLDAAGAAPASASAIKGLLSEAKQKAALPLLRRVYRYADIGKHRTWLDGRAVPMEPEIKEIFALSMSDHLSSLNLWTELPVIAAAYRLSGERALRDRVIEQLQEAATWSPLQRPGWCCLSNSSRLPADGKTGSWLATGTGVRAIATTLEIFPPTELPAELRGRLVALLEREMAEVTDDWKSRRQWFVQCHNVLTNQWVLPTEGLVRACLVVGREKHREAYEMGVANMIESIDAHGDHGEFEEGLHYASFTVLSMLHAAHAMAQAGDRRAVERPFLRRFAVWIVHHLMPGRLGINAFDAFSAGVIPRDHATVRELLSAAAAILGDPAARWALAEQFDGPTPDLAGVAAAALPAVGPGAAPPCYAAYERATRVNWRGNWRDDATGLWVRGGHKTDQHDHQDRGHVSFILHGRPVLIETGTPAYHHPHMASLFASGAGHNVLQIGTAQPIPGDPGDHQAPTPGWQKIGTVAPITVHRLDDAGGDVQVDGSLGYDDLSRWLRHLTWSADTLTVRDTVELTKGRLDVPLFRWHLATNKRAVVEGRGGRFVVRWPGVEMTLESPVPLMIDQEPRENNSLAPRGWDDPIPYPMHTCLLVRAAVPVNSFHLTTTLCEAPDAHTLSMDQR